MKWSFVRYKKGSYITVFGKPTENTFYIIKEGQCFLQSSNEALKTGSSLGPGDFINVVPVLSGHSCNNNIVAVTDTILLAINAGDLPDVINYDSNIALKILKMFSKELRYYDKYVETLSGIKYLSGVDNTDVVNYEKIYNTGQYYLNNGKKELARYAFTKYEILNPKGVFIKDVKEALEQLGGRDRGALSVDVKTETIVRPDSRFIFCESEPGNVFYFIKEGHIKITTISDEKETIFAILNKGDIFGEMAVLEDKLRMANAITQGETEVMAVKKEAFKNFLIDHTDIAIKLIKTLSDRVWVSSKKAEFLTMKNPIAKMYETLVTLVENEHIDFDSKRNYTFSFGFTDLAHMSGIDKDEIEGVIISIKKENVVVERNGHLIVSELKKLRILANYHKTFDQISKKHKYK